MPFLRTYYDPFYRKIRDLIGVRPKNTKIYRQALRHSSYASVNGQNSNERLEFLGDAVIELIVRDYLYERFPKRTEGKLTTLRVRLVNRDFLNTLGQALQLDPFIRVGETGRKYEMLQEAPALYGNMLEALVGAVFLDRGYTAAHHFFLERVVKAHADMDEVLFTRVDFKSRLLEWAQRFNQRIGFRVMKAPDDNEEHFRVGLYVESQLIIEGTGRKKKKAENLAAKKAFEKGLIDDHRKQVYPDA